MPLKSSAGPNGQFTDLEPAATGIDLVHQWNPPAIHRNLVNPIFGTGVAVGDIDNDGLQDLFIAKSTDAGKLYRNLGDLKFEDVTKQYGVDPTGMWTSGTTFVDINNDGRLDLYLCGFDCPNRLYINEGSKFSERAKEYGLAFHGCSIEMTFADYDRDGDLDGYLVTNFMKPKDEDLANFQAVLRRGKKPQMDKKFEEVFYFIEREKGRYKRQRGGQFDHLFRNDNGKFVDVTEASGIGLKPYMGLSANWWDYNNDGWPDLYVANDFKGPEMLYRNNGPDESGNVSFTDVVEQALPHTTWFSMGSDFGDINNDGQLDYLASDMAGTNHYRDKLSMGNMSGPDSRAWFLNFPTPPQYMRNALFLNTGTSRFMETAFLCGLAKTDWTWTVKFADFDNDGWQDVYFANGMTRDVQNSDLVAELNEIQKKFQTSGDKSKTTSDVVNEFWESKKPFRLENLAYRNSGNLKFESVANEWGLDHLGVSTGAAIGDLDNDGDLDLVVTGFEERVRVYRNDLSDQNAIRFQLFGTESNRSALGARINLHFANGEQQTRYLSPTRGFMSTSENIAHFGVGDADTIDKVVVRWPSGASQEFKNLETNRMYRIVESAEDEIADSNPKKSQTLFKKDTAVLADFPHREIEYDDFRRQPLLPNKYSQLGPCLACGDIDNDGDNDFYLGGAAFYGSQLLINQDGTFEASEQTEFDADINSEDMGALFVDVDADGDLDLYVVSGGVECKPGDAKLQDRLYMNDGKGNFTKSNWLPEMFNSGSCVSAADYDQDGDVDLFVGGRIIPGSWPEAARSVILKNSGDGFEIATDTVAPELGTAGMVTSAIWSDVNGDDWIDLLVTYEWGPVRYFQNNKGKLTDETEATGLAQQTGWFNSICGGDIDNDGDTDFVVGNFGLNTKYKASKEKPVLMFYGDFEGKGRKRILEAKYEDGVCLPRRGLSCSSHAMPMVKEKTPTFHEFATSDLIEIYSDEKIDESSRFEANSLYSIVLINNSESGSAKFDLEKLPNIAQASPIFGCSLNDVDGDGNLDLFIAQNFYGAQRETGYFDGGISMLLKGDGQGAFEPIDATESGIVITGDATSLVAADLNKDGRVDFIVGKNNDTPQVFINQSDADMVAVDLRSKSIGEKVLIDLGNGKKRLHEVTYGSGYLSQSPPLIFHSKVEGAPLSENVESQPKQNRLPAAQK